MDEDPLPSARQGLSTNSFDILSSKMYGLNEEAAAEEFLWMALMKTPPSPQQDKDYLLTLLTSSNLACIA